VLIRWTTGTELGGSEPYSVITILIYSAGVTSYIKLRRLRFGWFRQLVRPGAGGGGVDCDDGVGEVVGGEVAMTRGVVAVVEGESGSDKTSSSGGAVIVD
jgi:hypothetical protein